MNALRSSGQLGQQRQRKGCCHLDEPGGSPAVYHIAADDVPEENVPGVHVSRLFRPLTDAQVGQHDLPSQGSEHYFFSL
ncbi:hypothetical protein [Pontibacter akesuensis]|uniref:hypothetical protein n=1 Tax=Pontibacter akesuensis TaxID=388950 RepID=UPI00111469B0|nr:hypothetical protein [Pontibacter akesuensis]